MKESSKQKFHEKLSVDPFEHSINLTLTKKIQVALMTFTVLPLRVILFTLTLLILWAYASICTARLSFPIIKPAGYFGSLMFAFGRRLYRVLLFFLGFHYFEVKGKRAKCIDAPILVIAPHSSMMDMFVFSLSDPLLSGLSAVTNKQLPLIGTIGNMTQPIYVKRSDFNSRQNAMEELMQRATNPHVWPQTVLFPEAGCANKRAFLNFKTGAFQPGVPVQPVLIEYLNSYDCFSWTLGSPNPLITLWLCLCEFSIKTRITFLPIYEPSDEERKDAKLYANNVRHVMAGKSNLPETDFSYEDCRLAIKAEKLNLPWQTGVVEYMKISKKLEMNYNEMAERLVEFSKIDENRKDGFVSLEKIANHHKVSNALALKEALQSKNFTNLNETINFCQYLYLLSTPIFQNSVDHKEKNCELKRRVVTKN